MGGSVYSSTAYSARVAARLATATPVFKHTAAVASGKAHGVHASLSPKGVKVREARDSDAHPVSLPIGLLLDTTGSMRDVPGIIEERLTKLMGAFLDDKASGKRYIGDAYPAICIGAVDDYDAMSSIRGEGALQVGQFESGLEIDNDLENIWLTANGGGTYQESYELGLYFYARKTAHDNWEKRGRRGYLFLIGDEHAYPQVSREQVAAIIGDKIQANIPLEEIVREAQQRYHVFFVIPNMTQHYHDDELRRYWQALLGQQNVLKLDEPNKICETIVAAVALCEEHVGVQDMLTDGVITDAMAKALVPLAKAGGGGALDKYSAAGLPAVVGDASEVERL
jgi:hypothetical protein